MYNPPQNKTPHVSLIRRLLASSSVNVFTFWPCLLSVVIVLLNHLSPSGSLGVDVWWADGGHPLLQGRTHLPEVRPLQSSRRGEPGQGESEVVFYFRSQLIVHADILWPNVFSCLIFADLQFFLIRNVLGDIGRWPRVRRTLVLEDIWNNKTKVLVSGTGRMMMMMMMISV